ncbi:MAG: PQQ-binding-like beta-propeller repeat protein [Steroidobacteraceae bacterium]
MFTVLGACGGGSSDTPASTASGSGSTPPANVTFGTDVLTYHDDVMRSGQDLTESVLTPQNVNSSSFGKLRILAADGIVDAAPLIASGLTVNGTRRNVVYVASEHDSVYAYDADTGTLLARVSLLASGETPSDPRGCGQVSPEIGITSTPVIDLSAGPNGTLYVVAMSKDASGGYHQRLHALDLVTLADRLTAVQIQASAPGNGPNSDAGTLQFDPKQYKERAALLLANGKIYLTFASNCDIGPYNGWIMAYDESTLMQAQVLQITPNGIDGAVWDTGGMAADSQANIYAAVGNGTFDTALDAQGMPDQQDFGNAALKIATGGSALTVADYFTPSNTVSESANDVDFGSGSVMLLVDQTDTAGTVHHLLVAGGKDGNLYLLDRDDMGHYDAAADQVYQRIAVGGPLYSAPIYFNGSLYVGDSGGTLKAYAFSNAQLAATPSSQSSQTFSYPGTAPAVSAQGTANAILWAVESAQGSPAVLYAYDPADLGQQYYASSQAARRRDSFGTGNKFITPVIANGKVFVGTADGVAVFGLL